MEHFKYSTLPWMKDISTSSTTGETKCAERGGGQRQGSSLLWRKHVPHIPTEATKRRSAAAEAGSSVGLHSTEPENSNSSPTLNGRFILREPSKSV